MHFIDNLKFEDFSAAVETSVSVLTTATELLAASAKRQWVYLRNLSDTAVVVSFANSAASASLQQGIRLEKLGTAYNNSYEITDGKSIYVGAIYAKAPATGKVVAVSYYNNRSGLFYLPSASPSLSPSISPSLSPSISPSPSA